MNHHYQFYDAHRKSMKFCVFANAIFIETTIMPTENLHEKCAHISPNIFTHFDKTD